MTVWYVDFPTLFIGEEQAYARCSCRIHDVFFPQVLALCAEYKMWIAGDELSKFLCWNKTTPDELLFFSRGRKIARKNTVFEDLNAERISYKKLPFYEHPSLTICSFRVIFHLSLAHGCFFLYFYHSIVSASFPHSCFSASTHSRLYMQNFTSF